MSIKLFLENWRRFITEDSTEQQQIKTKYETVLDYLKNQGFELKEKPPSEIKILTDEERSVVKQRIENDLQSLGLVFNEHAPGSGFGRFELKDRTGGSIYVYIKPKKAGAAGLGQQYENDIADVLRSLLPSDFDVKTAGFGHGTDLAIKGQNNKILHMELKTSSGADFGQFKLKYDPRLGIWDTMKTKNFIENQDLFQGIFDDAVEPAIRDRNFSILEGDPFHYNEQGLILGLVRSPETPMVKQRLQKELFDGKSDLNISISPELIQKYYAKKGDSLISIQNKGVFALKSEASQYFGVKELKDSLVNQNAKVRFRVKPYMGGSGYHTFSCALKMSIQASKTKLTDPSFLQKIVDYLK